MLISWWANHSDTWSSSGLLFMWSVCSCPMSDRLACSPVVLLFQSSLFSASCVCSVPVLMIGVSSLDSGSVHQQPLPSPLQSPRCQGLLTLSKTHDSDCPVYSLSTLFNKLFSAFATGLRIYFLTVKFSDLGLNSSLCDWIQDFLTGRPQVVKMGQFTSNSINLNMGAPQGCVLSPLLYSLYTHDCVPSHSSTSIVKFADDTVVLGLINNNDEAAYLDEVERLPSWCQDNCLSLNVSKTKKLIVDFRKRQQRPYTPLMISGSPVERVSSFKYLGVNISEDLTWTTHIQTQVKKTRQRLNHLRQLRKFRVSPAILNTFYSGAIESAVTQCISVWHGNSSNQVCREWYA